MIRGSYNIKLTIIYWVSLIIFLALCAYAIRFEQITQLDRLVLKWFAASRSDLLDTVFIYISKAGSSYFLLPVTFAVAVMLSVRKHFRKALFFPVSFVGASLLINFAKHVIARPRPDYYPPVIEIPAGFSFPSSHSVQITAFVLAGLMLLNASLGKRWYVLLQVIGGLLIVLVCISRLYLQVHYPTDVMAGFLAAIFWLFGLSEWMLPKQQNESLPGTRNLKGVQQ